MKLLLKTKGDTHLEIKGIIKKVKQEVIHLERSQNNTANNDQILDKERKELQKQLGNETVKM